MLIVVCDGFITIAVCLDDQVRAPAGQNGTGCREGVKWTWRRTPDARTVGAVKGRSEFKVGKTWFNLVEAVWSHLKRSPANLAKRNLSQLTALVKTRLKRMQYQPGLLDGFLAGTGLDLTPFCNPHHKDLLVRWFRQLRALFLGAAGRASRHRAARVRR
jgi:hypothetical protein